MGNESILPSNLPLPWLNILVHVISYFFPLLILNYLIYQSVCIYIILYNFVCSYIHDLFISLDNFLNKLGTYYINTHNNLKYEFVIISTAFHSMCKFIFFFFFKWLFCCIGTQLRLCVFILSVTLFRFWPNMFCFVLEIHFPYYKIPLIKCTVQ